MIIQGKSQTYKKNVSFNEDTIVKFKRDKVRSNLKKIGLMRSPSFKTDLSKINDVDILTNKLGKI